jgi:TPP-dependent pyruvate/acetoin dehydrogenase alpha subunit
VLLEFTTYRWHGHYEGDPQPYKPESEDAGWRERDPLLLAGAELIKRGEATESTLEAVQTDCRERVEHAVRAARLAPGPTAAEAFAHVFSV